MYFVVYLRAFERQSGWYMIHNDREERLLGYWEQERAIRN